jgi:hypothetical protein
MERSLKYLFGGRVRVGRYLHVRTEVLLRLGSHQTPVQYDAALFAARQIRAEGTQRVPGVCQSIPATVPRKHVTQAALD